ncbi:hypothetical protein ACIRO3_30150 [Streptomyces sp. NPDC102278]|uniref:hypothetical protein n=1 Tax=Streptomyces sp. NPDC102278 TaxID=3366152 RepID=UPI003811346E
MQPFQGGNGGGDDLGDDPRVGGPDLALEPLVTGIVADAFPMSAAQQNQIVGVVSLDAAAFKAEDSRSR